MQTLKNIKWLLTRLLREFSRSRAISALATEVSVAKVSAQYCRTLLKVCPSTRRKVNPEQAPIYRGASKPSGRTLHNTRAMFGLILLLSAAMVGCEDDNNDHDFGSNDPNVYVAMGDSITSGLGYSSVEPYPAKLSSMLGKIVINKGHGGDLSSDGKSDVNSVLANYKPGYLLILYGANDIIYGYGTDHIIANLRAIIQAAKANKTIPVIATLTPAFDSHAYLTGGIDDLNASIRLMAAEEGVSVADLDSAFGGNSDYILSDGLHPNDEGDELMATTFFNVLN